MYVTLYLSIASRIGLGSGFGINALAQALKMATFIAVVIPKEWKKGSAPTTQCAPSANPGNQTVDC